VEMVQAACSASGMIEPDSGACRTTAAASSAGRRSSDSVITSGRGRRLASHHGSDRPSTTDFLFRRCGTRRRTATAQVERADRRRSGSTGGGIRGRTKCGRVRARPTGS
jgi:hypothetical protein